MLFEKGDSMAEWRAQLQGNNLDLQELKVILSDHDPTIIQENSDFYLKSKNWDQLEEAQQVRELASHIIGLLDSAAYIHFRDTAPITIGHIVRVKDDGSKDSFVFAEGLITLRSRLRGTATIIGPDGKPVENHQEHPIIKILRVSEKNSSVADALAFLRKSDWISIYKAFEIVRDEVNGKEEIISHGWLTRKNINRFTQTAQSRDALGDDARHASRKYKPPKDPMSIHEAKAIIGDLIQKWIDSLP